MIGFRESLSAAEKILRKAQKRNSKQTSLLISATVIGLLLIAIGVGVYLVGGVQSPLTQLMYLPILLAASLFAIPGAVIVAVAAGIALGPWIPMNVMTGEAQSASHWLYRTSLFVLFAAVAGYISRWWGKRVNHVESEMEQLSEVYTRVLSSLALTVEIRDEHTRGHCERVAQNTMAMGQALGFNNRQLETLYWGAILHDLGKIAVPESILLKPGTLTESEYSEIKRHSEYGADLLDSVAPEFKEIATVVRYHHERWDGLGYPARLEGEEIPLMSRMISVVDVFEALTSSRPYRDPMRSEHALIYLKDGAGTQFDSQIVALFEELYFNGQLDLDVDKQDSFDAEVEALLINPDQAAI